MRKTQLPERSFSYYTRKTMIWTSNYFFQKHQLKDICPKWCFAENSLHIRLSNLKMVHIYNFDSDFFIILTFENLGLGLQMGYLNFLEYILILLKIFRIQFYFFIEWPVTNFVANLCIQNYFLWNSPGFMALLVPTLHWSLCPPMKRSTTRNWIIRLQQPSAGRETHIIQPLQRNTGASKAQKIILIRVKEAWQIVSTTGALSDTDNTDFHISPPGWRQNPSGSDHNKFPTVFNTVLPLQISWKYSALWSTCF